MFTSDACKSLVSTYGFSGSGILEFKTSRKTWRVLLLVLLICGIFSTASVSMSAAQESEYSIYLFRQEQGEVSGDLDQIHYIDSLEWHYGEVGRLSIKVVDNDGNPPQESVRVIGRAQEIKVFDVMTDTQGVFDENIKLLPDRKRGKYQLTIQAQIGDSCISTKTIDLTIIGIYSKLYHAAFKADHGIDFKAFYSDMYQNTILSDDVYLMLDGERYNLELLDVTDEDCKVYGTQIDGYDTGIYDIVVKDGQETILKDRIIVWDWREAPADYIKIDEEGRFIDPNEGPFVMLGMGAMSICYPTSDNAKLRGNWYESRWIGASDRNLADYLGYIAAYGFNTVRIGLTCYMDHTYGDLGGYANYEVLERASKFLDYANAFGIKTIITPWFGQFGQCGNWMPEYDNYLETDVDTNWYTCYKVRELQKAFLNEVLEYFKGDTRIMAFELMSEIRGSTEPLYLNWINGMYDFTRERVDNLIHVSHLGNPDVSMMYANSGKTEFYGYRTYNDTFLDVGSFSSAFGKYVQIGNHPGMPTEYGCMADDVYAMTSMRDVTWMSILGDVKGAMAWTAEWVPPSEAGMISEIINELDWADLKQDRAIVAVQVDGSGRDLREVRRWDLFLQERGYNYDVVGPETPEDILAEYDTVIQTERMKYYPERPRGPEPRILPEVEIGVDPVVKSSKGYLVSFATRDNRNTVLAYLRNQETHNKNGYRSRFWVDFCADVNLDGNYYYRLYDLDNGNIVEQGSFTGTLTISIDHTFHDYVLVLQRSTLN